MHELPMVKSVYGIVLRHAEAAAARRVVSVALEIGALSELQDDWMQGYFDELSQGGVAEGAVLRVTRVPAVFSCGNCGQRFHVESLPAGGVRCARCDSTDVTLSSAIEYKVRGVEVE